MFTSLRVIQEHLWCRSDSAATVNYVDKEIADACLGGDALDVSDLLAHGAVKVLTQ